MTLKVLKVIGHSAGQALWILSCGNGWSPSFTSWQQNHFPVSALMFKGMFISLISFHLNGLRREWSANGVDRFTPHDPICRGCDRTGVNIQTCNRHSPDEWDDDIATSKNWLIDCVSEKRGSEINVRADVGLHTLPVDSGKQHSAVCDALKLTMRW